MANITERIKLQMGRNERWQDTMTGAFPSVLNEPRQLSTGKVVKRTNRSNGDSKIFKALRKRLDPTKF
jgi:hypothetical protein